MVGDYELARRIRLLLKDADLNRMTCKDVRKALERDLNMDLRGDMARIRRKVQLAYMRLLEEKKSRLKQIEEEEMTAKNAEYEQKRKEAFNSVQRLSSELEAVTGQPCLRRSEAVKLLWNYIRENNLQNPSNKTMIICSGNKLYDIFKVDSINLFQINKALQPHFSPMEEGYEATDPPPTKPKTSSSKGRHKPSSNLTPVPISPELKAFLGLDRDKLPKAEAIERIWEYIHDNKLQDNLDKSMIKFDDKLAKLFGCGSCGHSRIPRLVEKHLCRDGSSSSLKSTEN